MSDRADSISDEALAAAARTSAEAQSELISRYFALIRYHAARFAAGTPFGADIDDYVQEGLIALIHAVSEYRPEEGKCFSAFVQSCIINRMLDLVRREQRNASPVEDLLQHLEQQGELVDPDTPESVLLEKERYEDCRMRVMALLSEREWEILQCSLDGMRYQEIAQHLGTTVKAVDSAMQRIRRKMRAVRSTDYFDS